jgi:hypothetical protein
MHQSNVNASQCLNKIRVDARAVAMTISIKGLIDRVSILTNFNPYSFLGKREKFIAHFRTKAMAVRALCLLGWVGFLLAAYPGCHQTGNTKWFGLGEKKSCKLIFSKINPLVGDSPMLYCLLS